MMLRWFRIILITLALGLTITPVFAKTCQEDLNGDGVKETIRWREEMGGMNLWGELKISSKGKTVFSSWDFCRTWGREGFWLLDLDKEVKGKELVIYRDDKQTAKYLPDRFHFEIYHWKKGKYVLNRKLHSNGRHKTGKGAKKEIDALLAGKGIIKCYLVIAGSFKSKKEAEKKRDYLQQFIGDCYGYEVDRSEHYSGLRPGYWILVDGHYTRKGAEEWVKFAGRRDPKTPPPYIKQVVKKCLCDIFHPG